MGNKHTRIDFVNRLEYTEEFNTYTYRNFYNGAGVGMADFNKDGLTDLYFCSNMTGNKLYINKGDFVFEDITDRAGVSCMRFMVNRGEHCRCKRGWLARYLCLQVG